MQTPDPYDFDRVWPSEGTDSIKWEFISTPKGPVPWDRALRCRDELPFDRICAFARPHTVKIVWIRRLHQELS